MHIDNFKKEIKNINLKNKNILNFNLNLKNNFDEDK